MGLIEICNFADEFSLLFNPKLGLCSEWKLTHLFLTAVMFLLVGKTWEDQVNSPPVCSNNFSSLRGPGSKQCKSIKIHMISW